MEAIEAIMSRRSIRSFQSQQVEPDVLETLLRAAMAAPSAGNQQSWRFVVITERPRLDALSETSPYAAPLRRAPLAIVICAETRDEKHPGFWVEDCSAAMENLLLAAHALGLGAVWLGYHPNEDRKDALRAILGLPPTVEPFGIAAIGHPDESKPSADRFDMAHIHREVWS
jgi:nitroreductase